MALMVIKRDGTAVAFDATKILAAVLAAFLKDAGGNERAGVGAAVRDTAARAAGAAATRIAELAASRGMASVHIEEIQDQVELALMRSGEHEVARSYVLYRFKRAEARQATEKAPSVTIQWVLPGGSREVASVDALTAYIRKHTDATPEEAAPVAAAAIRDLFDGVAWRDVERAITLAARALIEREPRFDQIAAQLALAAVKAEVIGSYADEVEAFGPNVRRGIDAGVLDPALAEFDLVALASALKPERDRQFRFSGVQILHDRYLVVDKTVSPTVRIETPQTFFMRVAMGLALNEADREARAIEFYELLSNFDFMSSTPTLFNSGTRHPQLSSCYLTTIGDDLGAIYDGIRENAMLQKFAGGLGNDWTSVRAMGSLIKGTNGESQGVIPFLKVANDTAVAVNQGGKRKGAVCAYLETWHLDIEEFLDLRKNTGDDRRRTHDMNTANWIPDLFMKRVMENGEWTLFTPSDVPDLHDLYGAAFEKRYLEYEALAARGALKLYRTWPAVDLWRKMLTMLFETGHPWITFKDPCNIRSPQQHVGIVHSSNLCTEITLNTSDTEIAVCNLGSVNVANHVSVGANGELKIDMKKVRRTVATAMRMLDNVIDLNLYSVKKARTSNLKHRPVGLGMMGLHDALQRAGVPFASKEAVAFGSAITEVIAFNAIWASTALAEERGRYPSFPGSMWDRGFLPQDTVDLVTQARSAGHHLPPNWEQLSVLGPEWAGLRERIAKFGMRNSNCMAIAPTATISDIVGCSPCIEPLYLNLHVRSNLSGEFTVINEALVQALKARGVWDDMMINDLKYYDGSVQQIDRVPPDIKAVYATAFEIDPQWVIEAAAARGVWIDQAQSLNVCMAQPSGKKLDELYKAAWLKGLKTTYYLRTRAATSAEKSTGRGGELNAVRPTGNTPPAAVPPADFSLDASAGQFCSLEDIQAGTCESCQ